MIIHRTFAKSNALHVTENTGTGKRESRRIFPKSGFFSFGKTDAEQRSFTVEGTMNTIHALCPARPILGPLQKGDFASQMPQRQIKTTRVSRTSKLGGRKSAKIAPTRPRASRPCYWARISSGRIIYASVKRWLD